MTRHINNTQATTGAVDDCSDPVEVPDPVNISPGCLNCGLFPQLEPDPSSLLDPDAELLSHPDVETNPDVKSDGDLVPKPDAGRDSAPEKDPGMGRGWEDSPAPEFVLPEGVPVVPRDRGFG